jgi:hypothetical protein
MMAGLAARFYLSALAPGWGNTESEKSRQSPMRHSRTLIAQRFVFGRCYRRTRKSFSIIQRATRLIILRPVAPRVKPADRESIKAWNAIESMVCAVMMMFMNHKAVSVEIYQLPTYSS